MLIGKGKQTEQIRLIYKPEESMRQSSCAWLEYVVGFLGEDLAGEKA